MEQLLVALLKLQPAMIIARRMVIKSISCIQFGHLYKKRGRNVLGNTVDACSWNTKHIEARCGECGIKIQSHTSHYTEGTCIQHKTTEDYSDVIQTVSKHL